LGITNVNELNTRGQSSANVTHVCFCPWEKPATSLGNPPLSP
jgi:hypothetical protein